MGRVRLRAEPPLSKLSVAPLTSREVESCSVGDPGLADFVLEAPLASRRAPVLPSPPSASQPLTLWFGPKMCKSFRERGETGGSAAEEGLPALSSPGDRRGWKWSLPPTPAPGESLV